MKIEQFLPKVQKNIALKNHTTFRIGGPAKYFFVAKTKEDVILAIKAAKKAVAPFFILGGGSNLLVSDKGFEGLVVNFQLQPYGESLASLDPAIFNFQNLKVVAGAGLALAKLVNEAQKKGLTGLEWAVGIPGTIGGAVWGNAGAFDKSMKDLVETVEVFDTTELRIKNLKLKDCKFNYRDSIFKHKKNLIILSAELQLKKGNEKKIKERMKRYSDRRDQTQPLGFPCAGSIFKNPKGLSSAKLIEQCELKGKRIGDVQVSEKHANFILNLGKGKAADVIKLIGLIKKKVKDEFNIELKEEIQYLGSPVYPHTHPVHLKRFEN